MKKQLRLVLFAVLIMILVMMTVLAASAATDGAEVREEGHYYEVISAADGAVPKYYTTLAAAVGAVDADGYTITVLSNATEPTVALAGNYTYKITGGTDGATVTFNTVDAKKALINLSAGKVTLENLTLAYDATAITSTPAAVVYISGVSEVTLNNVVTSAVVTDTVSVNAAATITVSGDKTDISGGVNSFFKTFATVAKDSKLTVSGGNITASKYVMHLLAAATVDITGGTVTGSESNAVFYATAAGGSKITISNATVASGARKGVFAGFNANHTIALLEGAKLVANSGTMFAGLAADASITIDGAELHLSGAGAVLAASALKTPITSTAGKVFVENGAAVPAVAMDKTDAQNGFDWSVLSLIFPSYAGPCEITTGEVTITSLADNQKLASDSFLAAYGTRFPKAEVEIVGWIPLVVNGTDAVLNITAGEYVLSGAYMVEVKAGTLNITGGTVTGAEGNTILSVQGGIVNLKGGTLIGGAGGSVATVTGGAVNYIKGSLTAGQDGVVFGAQGGTVSLEGAEEKLAEHHYTVVANADAALKYYTTLTKALAAVDADGYIITVLEDTTESAATLNVAYAYTITGGAQGATLTFSSTSTVNAKPVLINLVAGKVTIDNLTLAYNSQTILSTPAAIVVITGSEAELTFNNVVSTGAVTEAIYLVAASKVTISGNKTDISGVQEALFRAAVGSANSDITVTGGKLTSGGSIVAIQTNAITVTITGGTLAGGTAAPAISATSTTGSVVTVSGATVIANNTLMQTIDSEVSLSLLAGAKVTVNNAVAFVATEKASSVVLNGADLYLEGESAILCADDTTTVTIEPTAGTIHLGKTTPVPSEGLDARFGNWENIAVNFGNYSPTYIINVAGVYNFASVADVQATAKEAAQAIFEAEYKTRFPLAKIILPDWIPVEIDHAEALVNFTAGKYDLDGRSLVTVKAGTLNILGGTYNLLSAGCIIDHQGGTVNISGGTFNGADLAKAYILHSTATEESAINISGGTFAAYCVVNAEGKVTVTVSDGAFGPVDRNSDSTTLYVHHADAKLNITGGTFENMGRAVWAAEGEVAITGGKFYTGLRVTGATLAGNIVSLVYVDGPAKVSISGDAELHLKKDNAKQAGVYVSENAKDAEVNISGGKFGGVDMAAKSIMYCVYVAGPIQNFNITGGIFYGGTGNSAILLAAANAVVNISGSTEIYAYRNVYVQAAATLNISGGSFNPRPNGTQPNNILIHITSGGANSTINVTGGNFNDYMNCFRVEAICTVNITGGTFTERTVCSGDTTQIEAFAYITKAATFKIGANENESGPMINIGRAEYASDPTYFYNGIGIQITASAGVNLEISGGTFNLAASENKTFDVTTGSIGRLTITGGTFYVSGEGARFLPDELIDVEGNEHTITGATVYASYGAYLPIYKYIDTTGLNLVVSGTFYVENGLTVWKPFAGEDPEGNGYVISTLNDIYTLLQSQFASFTVQGSIACASGFIPLNIAGEGVVVTLMNFTDSYNCPSLVKVTKGTLKVVGGTYVAATNERLFEVLGRDAALSINGGTFTVKGAYSYMIYLDSKANAENISVTGANMTVAQFGSIPLQVAFDVTANKVVVNGLSELLLSEAKEYTITSFADLTANVSEILGAKFPNLTVDIQTWIPLHLNNKDAKLIITGGEYEASAYFMFKITAGALEITGGKLTNTSGDIIHVAGANVTVTIDLPNDDSNGMYTEGRIVYVNEASGSSVTVKSGRFVEIAPDASGDSHDALFVVDNGAAMPAGATITIEGGYFEAARVLLINYVKATATINGGTFVSNQVGANAKATSAHMLAPLGDAAALVINGGSFDNKQGGYIIAVLAPEVVNAEASATPVTINSGSFNGGAGWFYATAKTALVINANTDPAKNPVFTDTEANGDGSYYIYVSDSASTVTINAGTFTGGVSSQYILYAAQGTWTVQTGTFTGSLFYIGTTSAVTVNGGSFTALGGGAKLFNFVGAVTSANLNITVPLATRVENGASILETTLAKDVVLGILSNVTFTISGGARLGAQTTLTKNETWSSPTDQQHLIEEYFGSSIISFEEPGVYSLNLTGNYVITITGGTWEFHGGDFLKLSGGADLVIADGTFIVTGGDIFNISGGASTVVIGSSENSAVKPQFVVGVGGNVLHLNNGGGAFDVTIYNGSFIKGEYIDGVLTPVIDYINYTSPLFYMEGGKKDASKLVIHDGYYEATRIVMDYYGYADTIIYTGVFKSNYIAENLKPEHYKADGVTPVTDNQRDLFSLRGATQTITIYGGEFDGGLGRSIFGLAGAGGCTWSFYGGTFTGGYYWIYDNYYITLNIDNTYDAAGNVIATPTFTAPTTYTQYGIYMDIASANGGAGKINIAGGSFSMKDKTGRLMLVPKGNVTVKISGGEFLVTSGNDYDDDKQLQNSTVILSAYGGTDYFVNTDITGGVFRAPRIIRYTSAGGTLNIYGGAFISNAISADDSYMLQIGHDNAVWNIYGGTFTGNNYTYSILLANTASAGTQTVNILGGSFNMGIRWIYVTKPTVITIDRGSYVNSEGVTVSTAPTFNGLSSGVGSDMVSGKKGDITAYGMYISNGAMGGNINIKYGTFKLPVTQNFTLLVPEGGDVTIHPGVVMETANRVIQITNAYKGCLTIKGGSFTSIDVGNLFYFTTTQAKYDANAYEGEIIIEGGTFTAAEASTIFHISSSATQYKFTIKGGTFVSTDSRLFIADGMGTQFVIEGGEFSSTASRMIYIDNNVTPLVIKGGTFTFLPKSGVNSDNAILYIVGKDAAALEVQGGTFIDQRSGSNQSFIKMNARAKVNFSGSFKLYVQELKDNFYYDYDDDSKSLAMTSYAPVEYLNDEPYYVCFGFYTANAPTMTTAPTLRAVLGAEGITYAASVSAEVAAALAELGTVTYGTLIFPTEYMANGWQSGTDFLAELKAYALDNGKAEGSVYTIVTAVNGLVTEADGSLTFRASLINIKEANYTRSITGIAFAKVTAADGTETYYYATHASAGVSSDIRTLAKTALNDVNSKPVMQNGRVYCYAAIMVQNRFSRYPSVFQDSLRKYLPENQRTPKY